MPLASFVGPDHLGGEVAGNGISKLVFAIISAVAEAERDRIVQGILDVKSDQRRHGRHLGGKHDATAARSERRDGASARTRGSHPGRRGRRHGGRNDRRWQLTGLLEIDEKRQGGPHLRERKPPFASRSTAV